jgi:hypothetical protein
VFDQLAVTSMTAGLPLAFVALLICVLRFALTLMPASASRSIVVPGSGPTRSDRALVCSPCPSKGYADSSAL